MREKKITAAGGYVMRAGVKERELLMIFRRGVWDLPKGKQDPGESTEECALREVREEIGISELTIVKPLASTMHEYEREGFWCVKTTHWFHMLTPEVVFTPEREEDIQRIAWIPWSEATRRVGYESLREHMSSIAERVL